MNLWFFISLIFGLQCINWIVGRKRGKVLKNTEDYFLAGRTVRFFPLMMTFIATQVGGGLFLGAADEAYKYGWSVLFYPCGVAVGLMILGLGIGKRIAGFEASTIAEILGNVYRSSLMRKITSILSIASLFMILVAQVIASQKFLVSLGVTSPLLFTIFWMIVFLYTIKGGLKGVISTDMIQAAFFSVVFIFAMVFCFFKFSSPLSFPKVENLSYLTTKISGWLLMPMLFMVIEQDMGQRCFAGNSPKVVSKASFWAGIFILCISAIPVYFGTKAKALGISIPPGGSALMSGITSLTNPWVSALVGSAILAAIISTATSLINAISSNLSNDFDLKIANKNSVKFAKAITGGISFGGLIFAFYLNNVVDLLIQSYELSVSCLLVPSLFAFFKKEGNFMSAICSVLFGVLVFFLFRIFSIEFLKEIWSIIFSLIGYGLGEWKVSFAKRQNH